MTDTAELHASLKKLNAARTPGWWEVIDEKRGHHHFQFVRAPEAVVKNDRGPDFAEVILAEDGKYLVEDMAFVSWCANNAHLLIELLARMPMTVLAGKPLDVLAHDHAIEDKVRDQLANNPDCY